MIRPSLPYLFASSFGRLRLVPHLHACCCVLLSLCLAGGVSAIAQQVAVTFPSSTPDPLATLNPSHPRMIASLAQFNAAASSSDPLMIQVNQRVIATANAMLSAPLVTYTFDSDGDLLLTSRAAFEDIVLAAMAYRLTGNASFAQRARAEMLNVAGFPDWNPAHFLDTSEMAMGVSLGFDWTYDALSASDRATIEQALMTKALVFAPQIYGPQATNPSQLPGRFQWVLGEYNWNQVCNGGMLAAAIAVASDQPAVARQVIQGVRAYLPIAMHGYAPDGAWFEGPVYMSYATAYTTLSLSILQSALGTDFGLSTVEPSFSQAATFHLQMQDPSENLFNYGDAHAQDDINYGVNPAFGWLARRFGSPQVASEVRTNLQQEFVNIAANQETAQYFAFNALWLPPDPGPTSAPPLDVHFRGGADIAIFRGSWTDPNAIFLGFKAGTNGLNHGHLDLGSFVFSSDGIRWSAQLGPDSYSLPQYNVVQTGSYRWAYFRTTSLSKGTIVPGHQSQSLLASAPIFSFTSTPGLASAVADLSGVYPGMAQQILRGVFIQNRSQVLIQDDISQLAPNTPLTWQMLTAATITVSIDGHTATLVQSKKTLKMQILSPANALFSAISATPPTSVETPNPKYTVLLATVPPALSSTNVRLAVLLTPVGTNWPANPALPSIQPLPLPTQ